MQDRRNQSDFDEKQTGAMLLGGLVVFALATLLLEWPALVWSTLHLRPALVNPLDGPAAVLHRGLMGEWRQPEGWAGVMPSLPVVIVLDVLLVIALVLLATGVGMRLGMWRGRSREHLSDIDPRKKVRPRAFAKPRDWAHLQPEPEEARTGGLARAVSRPVRPLAGVKERPAPRGGDGWNMGRVRDREVRSLPEQHLLGVAPTRSGKSLRIVATEAHEHAGPLVVMSNKLDVVHQTIAARRARGPVFVFAPLSDHPWEKTCWSPLPGCEYRAYALRMAEWIFDAHPSASEASKDSGGAAFYNREAVEVLLPPLLQAAAQRRSTVADVLGWLRGGVDALDVPRRVLEAEVAAERQRPQQLGTHAAQSVADLAGVQSGEMDDRARSLLMMSAAQLVGAYRDPSIAAVDRPGFIPSDLLDFNGTLYLIAPEGESDVLAPVFAGMLGQLLRECEKRAAAVQDPRSLPLLKLLCDEAAHLAPLRRMPTLLSVAGGWNVRICLIYQSIAQIRDRYGPAADAIIGNALCKLFLGPIHDRATRDELLGLLGQEWVEQTSKSSSRWGDTTTTRHDQPRPKLGAEQLAQLGGGDALAFHGRDLPALVHLPFWWEWQGCRSPAEALRRARETTGRAELLERQFRDAGGSAA